MFFLPHLLTLAAFLCVAAPLRAADVEGRRMVWAHYVPWYTPDNASQMPHRFHSYPQEGVGANPFREEIDRALAQGIDGFFHDMVAHKGGMTSYWNLRPFLRAAEGTPFQLGICLDAKTDVAHQVAADVPHCAHPAPCEAVVREEHDKEASEREDRNDDNEQHQERKSQRLVVALKLYAKVVSHPLPQLGIVLAHLVGLLA